MPQIVAGIVARKKFVYLCTNAILLAKHIDEYRPSPYLTFSIHLDGNRQRHDESVCQEGVFDKAVAAIRLAREQGLSRNDQLHAVQRREPREVAEFFDTAMRLGIEGITVPPGYSYTTRRARTCSWAAPPASCCSAKFSAAARPAHRRGVVVQSFELFLDFLAGNQTYQCTPWSMVTYNVFGWQRPCYLLSDEGYAPTYQSLIEDTEWDHYGVGKQSPLRQLHGALRLRGHGRQRRLQPSDQGHDGGPARAARFGTHGPGIADRVPGIGAAGQRQRRRDSGRRHQALAPRDRRQRRGIALSAGMRMGETANRRAGATAGAAPEGFGAQLEAWQMRMEAAWRPGCPRPPRCRCAFTKPCDTASSAGANGYGPPCCSPPRKPWD